MYCTWLYFDCTHYFITLCTSGFWNAISLSTSRTYSQVKHSLYSCSTFVKYSLPSFFNCTHRDVRVHCFSWCCARIKPRFDFCRSQRYRRRNESSQNRIVHLTLASSCKSQVFGTNRITFGEIIEKIWSIWFGRINMIVVGQLSFPYLHLRSRLFEDQISNDLVFKGLV